MPDFIFFAHFLRRRAWLLLAAPILYGLVAFGWSQRLAPVYQAQAMLQVSPASLSSGDIGAIAASERLASTYAQIIVQPATLEATIARLSQDGAAPTWSLAVTAEPIRETQLIRLRVEGPSPAAAAQVADAVAQTFIETNRMRQVARFAASKTNLEQQMAALETQIKQDEAGSASPEVLSRLRQSLSALTASYETVRLAETQASDNVTVVQPARASVRPLRPRPLFNALAAAIVGLMMALAAALLLGLLVLRGWCRYLCPLGALLGLGNKVSLWRVARDPQGCTRCGRYPRECIQNTVPGTTECVICADCTQGCPNSSVRVTARQGQTGVKPPASTPLPDGRGRH